MRSGTNVYLSGSAIETGHAICPHPVQDVGVVAISEKWFWIGAQQGSVKVGHHSDLIGASYVEMIARISLSESAALKSAARSSDEAPSFRVVGSSTGTNSVSSAKRRSACSCISRATAGAANDGESIATLSPG